MSQRNNNNTNNNNNYILGSSSASLTDGAGVEQPPNTCKNCGFTTSLFSLFQLHVQTCSSGRSRNSRSRHTAVQPPVQPPVTSRPWATGTRSSTQAAASTASINDRVILSTKTVSSGLSASLSTSGVTFPNVYPPPIQASTTIQTSSSSTSIESTTELSSVTNNATTDGKLPAPTVCRNYKCAKCSFVSNRAKKFLFHQKDVHGENIAVYGCNECEYASRHKNKVIRHKRLVHKMASSPEDIKSLEESPPSSSAATVTATAVIFSLPEVTHAVECRPLTSVLSGSDEKTVAPPSREFDAKSSSLIETHLNEVENSIPVHSPSDSFIGVPINLCASISLGCPTFPSADLSTINDFTSGARNTLLDSTKSDIETYFDAIRQKTDSNIDDSTLSNENQPKSPAESEYDAESLDGSLSGVYESKADFLDGTFRCKLCRYSNAHKWKIVSHIRSSHSKRTIFKCPFCEFITERKIEWCAHKTMHSGKMIFSCGECAYQTTMKRNYERHHERHLMNGPRRCSLCTYSSTGEGAIQRHIAEYHPPSPGKVMSASPPVCDEELPTSQAVIRLPQENVGVAENYFVKGEMGQECSKLSLSNPSPKFDHQESMRQIPNRSSLLQMQHYNNSSTEASPAINNNIFLTSNNSSLDGQFSMQTNYVVNNQKQILYTSISINAEETTAATTTAKASGQSGGDADALCRICGLVLRSEAKLRIHLIAHSSNARWTCVMCPLRYKRPADLNRHMKRKHDVSLKDVRGKVTTNVGTDSDSFKPSFSAFKSNLTAAHRASSGAVSSSSYALSVKDEDDDDDDDLPLNLSLKPSAPLCKPKKIIGTVSPTQSEPLDLTVLSTRSLDSSCSSAGDETMKMKCAHCSYVSKRTSDLRRHALVHCSERRYRCAHCGKSYKLQFDLTRHLNRAHYHQTPARQRETGGVDPGFNSDRFNPADSDADNKSDSSLTGVIAMPKISSPLLRELSCVDETLPPSFKQFQSINNLSESIEQTTMVKHMTGTGLGCRHCEYVGKSLVDLEMHVKTHVVRAPRRCYFCTYRTIWKGDMKRHYVKQHGSEIGSHGDLRDLIERTFRREKLKLSSVLSGEGGGNDNDSDFLDCNMNVHQHGEYSFDANATSIKNGISNIYASNRTASNVKLYHCPQCNFVSDIPSKVKSHLEIHENLKRFVCTICGKRSNWMWNVRKHIRKRHPGSDLMIRELSEADAKKTLDVYMSQRQTMQRKASTSNESANAQNDGLSAWKGNSSETREVQQSRNEEKKLSYEIESLAEQYANDVAAMFYGNAGVFRDIANEGGSGGGSIDVRAISRDCSMEMFNELAASRAAAKKNSGHAASSAAAKRFRPYKCSECGRRSNWRWDLNKHIRASHPGAHLVELTGTEARETFHEVLQRDLKEKATVVVGSGTKVKDTTSAWKHWHKPYQCMACGHRSNWKCDLNKHIRALHPCGAGVVTLDETHAKETLAAYDQAHAMSRPQRYKAVGVEGCNQENSKSATSSSPPTQTSAESKTQLAEQQPMISYTVDSLKLKRFQCSACPYRSNFRSDVGRHIRHKHDKAVSRIVVLTQVEASATLKEYLDRWARKKFVPSPSKRRGGASEILPSESQKSSLTQTTSTSATLPVESVSLVENYQLKCKLCEFVFESVNLNETEQTCLLHWKKEHFQTMTSDSNKVAETNDFDFSNAFEKVYMPESKEISGVDVSKDCLEQGCILFTQCKDAQVTKTVSCEICPYQASRPGLMAIHQTYHKPQTGHKLKCKHCPYYVSTPRLLHQHTRIHVKKSESNVPEKGAFDFDDASDNADSNVVSKSSHIICTRRKSGRTRYFCRLCPFISCNRNDYLYHRQFHRPRPLSTSYKCNGCSYWVSQKRLLSQHVKVHTPEYEERRAKYVTQAAAGSGGNSVVDFSLGAKPYMECSDSTTSISPAHAGSSSRQLYECRECVYRTNKMKSLVNHQRIHQNLKNDLNECLDKLKPKFAEANDSHGEGERHGKIDGSTNNQETSCTAHINSGSTASGQQFGRPASNTTATAPGEVEGENRNTAGDTFPDIGRLYNETKRLYCCDRCPYTNQRRDHLTCHMRFHVTRSELQCHYCDYSVSRVHLLNQHVRVHSSSAPSSASNAGIATPSYGKGGGANPAESFTEVVYMTRKQKQLESGRSSDMEMCSKVELEEMCWLVNIFRETGNIEKEGAASETAEDRDDSDDKQIAGNRTSKENSNCLPMEKMLKRVYMSFLELKPMSDSESDSVFTSDSETGSPSGTPLPKRSRKYKESKRDF